MTLLLVGLAAAAAGAQEPAAGRESHVTVYGDDACPESRADETVVCARRPEEERYRIPAPLRRSSRRAEASWSSHAAELEEIQRDTRPDSCSVVGSYGQTGCTQQMVRQWRAERRARRREPR
jgi:hypothetical protein